MTKLLLIIAGECFREGTQDSRLRDTDISVDNQIKATESHLSFIEHLKKTYNITTDIQLISYASKYENILINKYNEYYLRYKFYNTYHQDRTQLVNSDKIDDIEEYDSILAIRPDMYLKPFFYDIFDPYSTKICYPSVMWLFSLCNINQKQDWVLVNDTMMHIPKKYFDLVYHKIGVKLYHMAILDYISHSRAIDEPLLFNTDFNFFLKTLHDSDSHKDYNPIYTLVGRTENKNWYSYGYQIIEPDFLPIEINQKYTFPDWDLKYNLKYNFNPDTIATDNLWEWWNSDGGFHYLVNFIEIDTTKKNQFNQTSLPRSPNETYWKLNDRQELSFYDPNYNETSIFYRQSALQFFGKSLHNHFSFTLKKALNIYSNI